jgi:hypothetical protein
MRLFDCGSQFADWCASNCDRCSKHNEENQLNCYLERELWYAYYGNGEICDSLGERLGGVAYNGYFLWVCPEADYEDHETEMAAERWKVSHPVKA